MAYINLMLDYMSWNSLWKYVSNLSIADRVVVMNQFEC